LYKKLQLNKANAYELAIGTYHICEMVADFINGKCKYKAIAKEQGDVKKWDDYVLIGLKNTQIHYQIKENFDDLSKDTVLRDRYIQGDRKGTLRDLSPFDEAITALLNWYRSTPDRSKRNTKQFVFSSPFHSIAIKEGLPLRVLAKLCNEEIKESTDEAGLDRLATADSQIKLLLEWLTSWCGFSSQTEVLGVFRHLHVKSWNSTDQINEHSEKLLEHYFEDVTSVRLRLEDILMSDSNFTTITPIRYLLSKVWTYLKTDVIPWSKYLSKDHKLFVSGMQDVANDQENPPAIITGLWGKSRPTSLYLDIPLSWKDVSVFQNLLRICLHLPPGNLVHAKQAGALIMHMLDQVGDTIGVNALEPGNFAIFEKATVQESAVEREISVGTALDSEAESLSTEMSRHTWEHIVENVSGRIRSLSSPLITHIQRRWDHIKEELDANTDRRQKILCSMMHPGAERRTIKAELRVGIATATLLAEGIFYQLIILEALGAPDDNFEEISGASIQTIALSTWSGPMEITTRRVRKLSENADALIGKQLCDLLIMPQSDASLDYLARKDLASTKGGDSSLAAGRQIRTVVTGIPDLRQHIESGDIDAIRQHIRRTAS